MHFSSFLVATGLLTTVLGGTVERRTISTTCKLLKAQYPNITFVPTDAGYTAENEGKYTLKCPISSALKSAKIISNFSSQFPGTKARGYHQLA